MIPSAHSDSGKEEKNQGEKGREREREGRKEGREANLEHWLLKTSIPRGLPFHSLPSCPATVGKSMLGAMIKKSNHTHK